MKLIKLYLLTPLMVIFILMTVFSPLSVYSQGCPFNIENCRGGCGRWIDIDGDGICDLSARPKETKTDTVIIETNNNGSNQTTNNNSDSQNKIKENKNATSKVLTKESDSESSNSIENSTQNNDFETIIIEEDIAEKKPKVSPRYNFILYSALSFGFYFLSLLLLRLKVYSLKIHRRIWNILLLITFLVSGILGLVLVIQINYGVLMKHFLQFMQWHVDFGIGMAWISIFHIIWHFKYFKAIFTPSKAVNSKQ